jgi:hypothetical protein
MFLPNPGAILRSLSEVIRPGGVLAFQEASFANFLERAASLPLWALGGALAQETFKRSGTITDMEPVLPRIFREAGLSVVSTKTEILAGAEEWLADILHSLPKLAIIHPCRRVLRDLSDARRWPLIDKGSYMQFALQDRSIVVISHSGY